MMGLDEGVASAVAKALQERKPRTANTNKGRNELQAPWEVSGLPPLWGDERQSLNIESLRPASLPAYPAASGPGFLSARQVSQIAKGDKHPISARLASQIAKGGPSSVQYQRDRCLE